MAIDLQEFYHDFFQDVVGAADAKGAYLEDAFFEKFCDFLIEEGELETADRAYFQKRGLRVDGYGGDPRDSGGLLTLIICEFDQSNEISTLTASEMETVFKRGRGYLAKALDPVFRNDLEETHPAYGLSDLIAARWKNLHKVRLILITNKVMSTRIDGRAEEELDGKTITHTVWDIGRIHKILSSKQRREEIVIDLENEYGGALPVLPAVKDGSYESFLAVVPGTQLARIYDRWHTRLLEQNVRVFLQARGKVNKGMRNTLDHNPDMFFAYNNGITATAEGVELQAREKQLFITGLKNFQIVNGGQTTASIHAASKRKGTDLSSVFVQMKLSIVDPEQAMEIVPKISEYANSQNKVSAADFFSNHPFHQRMEEFSRRMYAPNAFGGFHETKWFYERARGQYNDARANLTQAQRNQFDAEYPKQQKFTKTDLAKFLNVWRELPHIVSRGAQKNFAEFGEYVDREWEKDEKQFNEMFYRHLIGKAIVFKHVERLVSGQPWYEGGYRANIVAYAISKMAHDVRGMRKSVNFDKLWRTQVVPGDMHEALKIVAKAVHDVLIDPPSTSRNVTEWAKKEPCWDRVRDLKIDWPLAWQSTLESETAVKQKQEQEKKKQKELNGIQAQAAVIGAGPQIWLEALRWGREHKLLSDKEEGILETASRMGGTRYPSDKQSIILIQTLEMLNDEGFQQKIEMPA